MTDGPLITATELGLYCEAGDFYIDPWAPVPRAVITHAHGDHARPGSQRYLTADSGRRILQMRMGEEAVVDGIAYGETLRLGGVAVSLHPAGHILGSAQIRMEHRGQVCVVSGDFKTAPDPTAAPLEVVRCNHFVSECTFGLPLYRWPRESEVLAEIHAWWRASQEQKRTCVLLAYALGKSQRILNQLDASVGPILLHGAVFNLLPHYQHEGIFFPTSDYASPELAKSSRGRALVLAPPSARGSTWIRKFGPVSVAMASGWMQLRGTRRRKALDRGFILSDHADWNGLSQVIAATGAERVWLTHGTTGPMARWLSEQGIAASAIPTPFAGEDDEGNLAAEPTGDEAAMTAADEEPT